jgi:hypothetical protein
MTTTAGWFKIAEDGLDSSGKWGVDRLIASGGVQTISIPACIAPGQYLLRGELIALHSASSSGGAQFYMVSYPLPVPPACWGRKKKARVCANSECRSAHRSTSKAAPRARRRPA